MNRNRITVTLLGLLFVACAGFPARANAQQSSADRKQLQTDGSKSAADQKDVKRLDTLAAQAIDRAHQAHETYLQKIAARQSDFKSFGAKDSRTVQAGKEEATAKQDWMARIKEEKEVTAQRTAAIQKAHAATMADRQDVNKLESDEHKKQTSAPSKK